MNLRVGDTHPLRSPMTVMRQLFTPEADADLARTVTRRPLVAFDFDGTLAPIVARPSQARVPVTTVRRLNLLTQQLPLAVLSGRTVADLRRRLGFVARVRGRQSWRRGSASTDRARIVCGPRWPADRLRAAAADCKRPAVTVEDKGASIALHYRQAPDRAAAIELIDSALDGLGVDLSVFGGKMVINIVPAAADDKAAALRSLVSRADVDAAVFLGDDVNDESVFEAHEPTWLTVCVGVTITNRRRVTSSAARTTCRGCSTGCWRS